LSTKTSSGIWGLLHVSVSDTVLGKHEVTAYPSFSCLVCNRARRSTL